jgi:cell division septation protein DedD
MRAATEAGNVVLVALVALVAAETLIRGKDVSRRQDVLARLVKELPLEAGYRRRQERARSGPAWPEGQRDRGGRWGQREQREG